MGNRKKKVGPVSVYLTREQVNAILYLLDCFPAADCSSVFARDAEKLKRKILLTIRFCVRSAGAAKSLSVRLVVMTQGFPLCSLPSIR